MDELFGRLPGLGVDTHVVAQPRDLDRYATALGRDRVHLAPGLADRRPVRLAWEQVGLPTIIRRVRPDIVHSPHYTMPIVSALGRTPRNVVTVHDATFFSHPELHLGSKARFFRAWTAVSGRLADEVVAPSEATRAALARHTHTDPARISVVPHGVDHDRFRPATDSEVRELRRWLGLEPTRSYVAFLGTLEPRKNVPALIRAFGLACAGTAEPPVLVVAGGQGWDHAIEPAVAELPVELTIRRPGFVPDSLVPALLGGAEVVAYPAHGEGFGLPVLEAMACGAAVLTTDRLALSEVGGDAVRYARTTDAADIADALSSLLADPDERRRLGAAGLQRARSFTWEATARAHLDVYERAMAR